MGPPGPIETAPLAVDPSGQYLYVGGPESGIAIYQIDQTSGALSVINGPPEFFARTRQFAFLMAR